MTLVHVLQKSHLVWHRLVAVASWSVNCTISTRIGTAAGTTVASISAAITDENVLELVVDKVVVLRTEMSEACRRFLVLLGNLILE